MKEQWKKLDSDGAKLLVDVEEGRQLPIKINIPLSALTPPREEFCCNRLLTVLRVCVLLALLTLIGWTATSLYSTPYYGKSIAIDEQSSLENTFAFQNLVHRKKDDIEAKGGFQKSDSESDEFRDSTKKSLDLIAAQMKGLNEKLDQMQVEKKEQQIETKIVLDDAKPIDEEVVASDPSLDSIFEELAEKVGLADNEKSDNVVVEYKPELDAIIITEPLPEVNVDLRAKEEGEEILALLKELGIEPDVGEWAPVSIDKSHEESDYQTKLVSDAEYQSMKLDNAFWNEKSNEEAQFDTIVRNSEIMGKVENEEAQKKYFRMWDRIGAETMDVGHFDESHEEDKQLDQVIQAMINRIATSNLENDNDSEQEKENEDEVENELTEEVDGNIVEEIMRELITDPLAALFGNATEEASKEDGSSAFENIEESHNEDKVEKEMMEQMNEEFQNDDIVTQFIGESLSDLLGLEIMETVEEETKMENDGDNNEDSFVDNFGGLTFGAALNFMGNDDEDKKDSPKQSSEYLTTVIPKYPIADLYPTPDFIQDSYQSSFTGETVSDLQQPELPFISPEEPVNKEVNFKEQTPIQEEPSAEKSLIEMVPSVEYVKKIKENPFIPRVAKMLEPIVGQNHELLVWYYTHKDLPYFLKGADKWKVFGAKLLYDSNIKDYPADATIVSGLAFEKVYGGAEYPSSSEEIQAGLQQEIVNRLILKSYLNKMLLEGNAEAETLSQVIEQHNQEKLKELDIDPQQLSYNGDFFEVSDKDSHDLIIPVVKFDPFVDESREANEQRAQVLKAFGKTRIDDDIVKSSYERDSKDRFDSISYKAPELPVVTKENSEDSSRIKTTKVSSEISEGLLGRSVGVGTSDESSDDAEAFTEIQTEDKVTDSAQDWISKQMAEESILPEFQSGKEARDSTADWINEQTNNPTEPEYVDMNEYLYSYDDPFDW